MSWLGSERDEPQRSSKGFTLLEVLAATLIFVLAATVLIGTSSAGVRMAGVSATRLEASLLADAELAQIERALNAQQTPPPEKEEADDLFAIRVLVQPALESFGNDAGDLASILATEAPGIEAFLLRYEIRVEWLEGTLPMSVRRTTFAFDWEGARTALPDLFAAGTEADGLNSDDPDNSSSSGTPQLEIPSSLQ